MCLTCQNVRCEKAQSAETEQIVYTVLGSEGFHTNNHVFICCLSMQRKTFFESTFKSEVADLLVKSTGKFLKLQRVFLGRICCNPHHIPDRSPYIELSVKNIMPL